MKNISKRLLLLALFVLMVTLLASANETDEAKIIDFTKSFIKDAYNTPSPFDYEAVKEKYLKEGNNLFNEEVRIRNYEIDYLRRVDKIDGTQIKENFFEIKDIKVTKEASLYKVSMTVDRSTKYDRGDIKDHVNQCVYGVTIHVEDIGNRLYIVDLYSDDGVSNLLCKNPELMDLGYEVYTGKELYRRDELSLRSSDKTDKKESSEEEKMQAILRGGQSYLEEAVPIDGYDKNIGSEEVEESAENRTLGENIDIEEKFQSIDYKKLFSTSHLNRKKARDWARKHALVDPEDYAAFTGYRFIDLRTVGGGDCTNFVSQVIYSGGATFLDNGYP